MAKKKTSLNIEEETWQKWIIYVVTKCGSARKISEETEKALTDYIKNNPIKK